MLITAKFTKLSCFVNTVLQLCLILDKLLILCRLRPFTDSVHKSLAECKGAYNLSALSHFNVIIWLRRPRALDTFQHWVINGLWNKILNSAVKFHIDSLILMLLTIIYSSIFHITAVSKHAIVDEHLSELVHSSHGSFQHWRLHPYRNDNCELRSFQKNVYTSKTSFPDTISF